MYSSTGAKTKPMLDEGGFQQLLAAAYVLQQHNDSLRAKDPRLDPAWIFSQITETESLVRQGGMDLAQAASLIAERLCKMTSAVSVSVCLLKDGFLDCVAETGIGARTPVGSLASKSPTATERLKNGRQFQSLDAQADNRLDVALCRELGVRSLLAVPIQGGDEIAGLLEVRWGLPDALHECDVRTCRLMSGLLTELLARQSEPEEPVEDLLELPKAKMVAPLEVFPDTARDHEIPTQTELERDTDVADEVATSYSNLMAGDLAAACRVCGRPFATGEAFCGNCSMPRVAAAASVDGLQSKWASMWFMQQAQDVLEEKKVEAKHLRAEMDQLLAASRVAQRREPATQTRTEQPRAEQTRTDASSQIRKASQEIKPTQALTIASKPNREDGPSILEHLRRGFNVRLRISRRVVALAIAAFVFLLVLATWSSWPSNSSSQLTWFEALLVQLGLAEVPPRPAPVYSGNPDVRVWEDVHTALYYCPGSDLYGKTPGGRFSTQKAAQEEQFESATRIACQ